MSHISTASCQSPPYKPNPPERISKRSLLPLYPPLTWSSAVQNPIATSIYHSSFTLGNGGIQYLSQSTFPYCLQRSRKLLLPTYLTLCYRHSCIPFSHKKTHIAKGKFQCESQARNAWIVDTSTSFHTRDISSSQRVPNPPLPTSLHTCVEISFIAASLQLSPTSPTYTPFTSPLYQILSSPLPQHEPSKPHPSSTIIMEASDPSPYGKAFGISIGKGLGTISPKYFAPETWTPLLGDDLGRVRYGKFVAAMMGRFRFGEFVHFFLDCEVCLSNICSL